MKKYKKGRTMRGKKERKIQIFIIFYYLSFSLLNTLEKVSNMLHILQLIRTLVAPSNPGHITSACQLACKQGDVLEQLEEILLAR